MLHAMNAAEQLGVKGLVLAPSALFNVHAPLADMVKRGTVKGIIGSLNGAIVATMYNYALLFQGNVSFRGWNSHASIASLSRWPCACCYAR